MFIAAVLVVAALFLLAVIVRRYESSVAFWPTVGETATPDAFDVKYEPLSIGTRDGETLRAWWMPHQSPRASILYFHGNGGNLSVWAPILAGIAQRGYTILAFDYRGYGLSSGRPTERGLYSDVDAVMEEFHTLAFATAPTVYWGRSLGVAMAAYASTRRMPDGLILEAGFPSARSLLRHSPALKVLSLFSTYRFPAAAFLQRRSAPGPVLILHGGRDRVVPIREGRALFESLPDPKRFVTIPGGDHNDVEPSAPATYWHSVDEFVASLKSSPH
ncbi:MAG TPA: alpha/beta hydrolase [Vicinamibacterales bacterium]|nr:alpha/beta hydrolase [Vicinamibacterales bacterium]